MQVFYQKKQQYYFYVTFIILIIFLQPVHWMSSSNFSTSRLDLEPIIVFGSKKKPINIQTAPKLSITHNNIWPISGNTTLDLPQSSPFGPRLKASDDYRYDFHRGIDIPADYGTPIYAIADGYVRLVSINDTHEQKDDGSIVNLYSSTVIQLKHNVSNWPDTYYSTYLHVNGTDTQVSFGSFVSKGQIIGFVGDDSTTDFAHLHFEIRYDGLYQYHNRNPWEFLPYTNVINHEATIINITNINSTHSNITVQLEAPANELDVDGIEITTYDLEGSLLENRSLSFNSINRNVTEDYIAILDNNTISKDNYLIQIFPSRFNALNSTLYWNFTFIDFPVSNLVNNISVRGLDIYGIGSTPANLTIDTTPPSFTIESPIATTYATDTVTVSLSGDAAHYWYFIEGTDSSNQTWTPNTNRTLTDGTYTIHVYGNDTAGNELHVSVIFSIDTTPPTFTIESPTATTYTTDTITISLSGDAAQYWYYIEGIDSSNQTWTSNVNRSLDDGTHKIHVYGNDIAGNELHVSVIFSINTTAPTETEPDSNPDDDTNSSTVSIPGYQFLWLSLFCLVVIKKKQKSLIQQL
jgi:hypothetical protein